MNTVKNEMAEVEITKRVEHEDQGADGGESPCGAGPEFAAESLGERQPVQFPGAAFDASQYKGRNKGGEHVSKLFQQVGPEAVCAKVVGPCQVDGDALQDEKEEHVEGESPSGPQTVASEKKSARVRRLGSNRKAGGFFRSGGMCGWIGHSGILAAARERRVRPPFSLNTFDMVKHSARHYASLFHA